MSKYGVFSGLYFPHSDWMWSDTPYLSVFSPNAGKYGPEKTSYLDTFHAVHHSESEFILCNNFVALNLAWSFQNRSKTQKMNEIG